MAGMRVLSGREWDGKRRWKATQSASYRPSGNSGPVRRAPRPAGLFLSRRIPYICTVPASWPARCGTPSLLPMLPAYAELHCLSNFSFLRGASHPEELVERAHALGYAAIAITDECSLA